MDYLDTDGDGTINFDEFLVGIRVIYIYCVPQDNIYLFILG